MLRIRPYVKAVFKRRSHGIRTRKNETEQRKEQRKGGHTLLVEITCIDPIISGKRLLSVDSADSMNKALIFPITLIASGFLYSEESAETVDLRFEWPDGLVLSVERSFNRLTTFGPTPERSYSKSEYLWSVKRSGDEFLIEFSDYREFEVAPPPDSTDPVVLLEYVSKQIEPILPTIVVDVNAQPIRLDGLDRVKSFVENEIRSIPDSNDAMFQRFAPILLNEQSFQIRALEDWNRMVQVWSGNEDAEIGGSFETIGVTGHASGQPIENLFIYEIARGPNPETVSLTVIQKPIQEQMKQVLDAMLGGDAYDLLKLPKDAELTIENRFTTICDPSTLIPVTYEKTKLWGASLGENLEFKGRKDTWTYSFSKKPADNQDESQ